MDAERQAEFLRKAMKGLGEVVQRLSQFDIIMPCYKNGQASFQTLLVFWLRQYR